MKITIWFDGGCKPNPGQMYGSYAIEQDGTEVFSVTEDYGHGTNNSAEYIALIHALEKTVELLDSSGLHPNNHTIEIFTDSINVRNRVSGKKRDTEKSLRKLNNSYGPTAVEAAHRMAAFSDQCRTILKQFQSFSIEWNPREVNVMKFGH